MVKKQKPAAVNNHVEDGEEEAVEHEDVVEKRDWASATSNMNQVSSNTDEDDVQIKGMADMTEKLDIKAAPVKTVHIKREDINLIIEQLELPKKVVERKLAENDGDPIKTMTDLMGFA
uniref:HYPK_UBA domain-containing protein n=1 Tax=Steinernema glaseri TaxID=37863 RepID=A0A1I7ZTA3_9BILA